MNPQVTRLNLVPGGVLPVVNVNQYDKAENALTFEIYDGPVPYEVSDEIGILIMGTKPDKNGFSYNAMKTGANEVTTNLEQQMTVLAGDVACEIRFQNDARTFIHGTLNFILRVEPAALNENTPISETELPLIEQAVEISNNIAQYISEAANNATKAQTAAAEAKTAQTAAELANANVQAKASQIDGAITAANTAAQNANDTVDDIQGMLARGELKGEKGDKGDRGESGVYVPLDGFFTMAVEPDGNLYVYSNTDLTDSFEYDDTTGALYYITDDGT